MANSRISGDGRVMSLGLLAMLAVIILSLVGRALGVRDPEAQDLFEPPLSGNPEQPLTTGVQGTLPSIIRESSGVAVSGISPDLVWTHNDGGDGRLFLVRRDGQLASSFRVTGVDLDDVEDVEVSECPPGHSGGSCLYLADTGDNNRNRESYSILFAPEPTPEGRGPSVLVDLPFQALNFRFADESRDVEALAVSPSGQILVITKGQEGAADVFRIDATVGGEPADAVQIARLPIDVDEKENRITAAAFNASGETLVVRSDEVLYLFAASDLETAMFRCVLSDAGQGEGVDFVAEDLFIVTREGEPAPIEIVRCP